MSQHIICRKTEDELGASYAVKVSSKIYEGYGEEFLRSHFNFFISQALADLVIAENFEEWVTLNKQLVALKCETIPHYVEVLQCILPLEEDTQENKEDIE